MVTELLAVVAGEDDQGVLILAAAFQVVEQTADMVIDFGNQAVVARTHLAPFMLGQIPHVDRVTHVSTRFGDALEPVIQKRMLGPFGCERLGALRWRHAGRVDQGIVGRRRIQWWVRTEEDRVHEPRACALSFQIADDPVGGVSGVGVFRAVDRIGATMAAAGGQRGMVRCRLIDLQSVIRQRVTLASQLGQPRQADLVVVAHPFPEAGQHAAVVTQGRIGWVAATRVFAGVGVTEQHRIESGLTGLQRDVAVPRIQWSAIEDGAVIHRIQSGQHACARRAAGCGLSVVAGEQGRLAGKRVQSGGAHHWMSECGQAFATPLIGGDEQDVAALRFHAGLPLQSVCRFSRCAPG